MKRLHQSELLHWGLKLLPKDFNFYLLLEYLTSKGRFHGHWIFGPKTLEWKASMMGAICVSPQAGTRWEPGGEPEEASADHRAVLPGHHRIVQRVPTAAPQCLPLSLPGRTSTPHPPFHYGPSTSCSPSLSALPVCAAPLAHFELLPLHSEVSRCCSTRCSLHHMHHCIAEHTYRYNTSRTLCFIIFVFKTFTLCQGCMSLKHHETVTSGLILNWGFVFLAFAIVTVHFGGQNMQNDTKYTRLLSFLFVTLGWLSGPIGLWAS